MTATSKGAMAAMRALRHIEQLGENQEPSQSAQEYLGEIMQCIDIAKTEAGISDPRIAGFVGALVEYIHMVNTAGTPDLECWRPFCAMTDKEVATELAAMECSQAA
jgi:hypothetical protein